MTITQSRDLVVLARPVRTSARPWILMGLSLILGLLGVLGAWAATASISGAVIGNGVFTVSGKRKAIQHLEGGIVRGLLVRDGDVVAAGQRLVELEPTRAKASLAILESGLGKELATEARLIAERDGAATVSFPPELLGGLDGTEVIRLIESENAIFEAHRAALKGDTEILQQRIAQLVEERGGLDAQRAAKVQQLGFIGEELEGLRHLLDMGQTTKTRVLALERSSAALRGEEGELMADMARTGQRIGETRLQILQRQKDFQKSVAEELQRVQASIRDLRERAVAARDVLGRIHITAPVGGTVLDLAVHTVGAVIKPSETIMEIVPGEKTPIVEVSIRPQDIDNVTVGQQAVLRLLAFKQRTTPLLKGSVIYVSADSLQTHAGQEPYYLVHIALPDSEIERLGKLKLRLGMQTEVMIKTGKRTPLQYIAQPIIDSMNRAMREE